MAYKALVVAVIFLMTIPSALSLEAIPGWNTACIDSETLNKTALIQNITDGVYLFAANQSIDCPNGCDLTKNVCYKWPANAISGEYFILFEILALSLLIMTLWRTEIGSKEIKVFDVASPLLGFILFVILALQGNNVIDMATGEGIPMVMVVWFDFGLSFLMLMFFFLNIFKWAKSVSEEGGLL